MPRILRKETGWRACPLGASGSDGKPGHKDFLSIVVLGASSDLAKKVIPRSSRCTTRSAPGQPLVAGYARSDLSDEKFRRPWRPAHVPRGRARVVCGKDGRVPRQVLLLPGRYDREEASRGSTTAPRRGGTWHPHRREDATQTVFYLHPPACFWTRDAPPRRRPPPRGGPE